MSGIKIFIIAYLLGGVTFIPLVIITFIYLNKKVNNTNTEDENKCNDDLLITDIDPELKAGKYEEKTGVDVLFSGWISITNQYYYHFTEIKELGLQDDITILERSQLKRRQKFFVILREGNLFLYKDDSQKSNLLYAISLKDIFVTIWPRYTIDKEPILDASLYTKKTCIGLFRKGAVTIGEDGKTLKFAKNNIVTTDVANQQDSVTLKTSNANQFYLYFENNMDKEDWYFQLINASKNNASSENNTVLNPCISAETAHLNTSDALYLIQTINSTKGQLTTKWLNALLGRLFLSLQGTDSLNQILLEKVYKKLTKINKPGFLDDFVIEKVDVGNSVPFLTNPRLSELSPEGSMKVAADLSYKGSLEIIISTKVNINLGSHFKPREVSLQLSIKVKELTGPLLVLFKPPPSNRLWYAFEKEPVMELDIEPIVSSSKLSYNVITNAIKGKFAEAIKESLVIPYYDDIVFYSTTDEIYRGGVWSRRSFKSSNNQIPTTVTAKVTTSENSSNTNVEYTTGTNTSFVPNETSVKSRTMEKMGSIKNTLKASRLSMDLTKSSSNSNISEPDKSIGEYTNNNDSKTKELANKIDEHSAKSKKYIKNSMSKINKWYKDNVSNKDDELFEDDDESEDKNEVSINENIDNNVTKDPPQMISNRRTINRKVQNGTIGSPVIPNSGDDKDGIFETSPVIVATEMFANKQRSISTSSGGNSIPQSKNYSQFTSPNMKEYY